MIIEEENENFKKSIILNYIEQLKKLKEKDDKYLEVLEGMKYIYENNLSIKTANKLMDKYKIKC